MLRGVPVTEIGSRLVTTVFDLLLAQHGVYRDGLPGDWSASYDDATQPCTPAWAEEITSAPARLIARIGREFARNAERTRGRSMIVVGTGTNQWLATTAMDKMLFAVMTGAIALGMAETLGVNLLGGGYNYRDTVSVIYRLHVISALVFIALWPFTRLVHVWSAPVAYPWRPYIVCRRRPAAPARVPETRGHHA